MDIAATKATERIARVLAGQHLSKNADGDDAHAAGEVDAAWRDYQEDAVAILKTLREPDEDMERAGDIAIWQRMIEAALAQASHLSERLDEPPEPRSDSVHEGP